MQKKYRLFCLFMAALLLSGCGIARPLENVPTPPPGPTDSTDPAPVQPDSTATPEISVTRYYNDYLHMTLTLADDGTCTLRSADTDAAGTYSVFPGGITLDFGTRQETAYEGENGDLTIEGRSGWFLRDWDFWGITEEETAVVPAVASAATPSPELLSNPDGSFRIRDYDRALACSCAAGIEQVSGDPPAPLTFTDGQGAYVTGRNITESFSAFSGSAADYLKHHMQAQLLADFVSFYGPVDSHGELTVRESEIDGRLAEAELRATGADGEISIHAIVYTSAYADGTENYICKCYFVPDGDTGRMAQLAEAVSDMTAVRLKTES